jgi:hypothetical protein
MFTNLHLLDNNSNAYNDDEKSNWITNEEGVVDVGGFILQLMTPQALMMWGCLEPKCQMLLWNKQWTN